MYLSAGIAKSEFSEFVLEAFHNYMNMSELQDLEIQRQKTNLSYQKELLNELGLGGKRLHKDSDSQSHQSTQIPQSDNTTSIKNLERHKQNLHIGKRSTFQSSKVSPVETDYHQFSKENDLKRSRTLVRRTNMSSNPSSSESTHERSGSMIETVLEVPTERLSMIPSKFFRIPHDQLAILNRPDSWLEKLSDSTNTNASIPEKVRKEYILLWQQTSSYSRSGKEPQQTKSRKLRNQNPARVSNHIPGLFFSVPDDQLSLLKREDSWFENKDDTIFLVAKIPDEVTKNLTSFTRCGVLVGSSVKPSQILTNNNTEDIRSSSINSSQWSRESNSNYQLEDDGLTDNLVGDEALVPKSSSIQLNLTDANNKSKKLGQSCVRQSFDLEPDLDSSDEADEVDMKSETPEINPSAVLQRLASVDYDNEAHLNKWRGFLKRRKLSGDLIPGFNLSVNSKSYSFLSKTGDNNV